MGCDSTCCGSLKDIPAVVNTPTPSLTDTDIGVSTATCNEDISCCPQPNDIANDSNTSSAKGALKRDGCCSSKPVDIGLRDTKRPSCCEDKLSPCCDSSCIERIALRECAAQSKCLCSKALDSLLTLCTIASRTGTGPWNCTQGNDRVPCQQHKRSAQDRFQSKLEALGCICRALLDLGQESCCAPSRQSSLGRKRELKTSTYESAAKSPLESEDGGLAVKIECCADDCSDEKITQGTSASPCADVSSDNTLSANACASTCYTHETRLKPVPGDIEANAPHLVEPEMGLSGKKHVLLSISGMTCTGCETKLSRTLAALPAVTKLKTSLVLSRAEFELDIGVTSANDVMRHVERTTEFKCERISNQGSTLDLICHGNATDIVKSEWPNGVVEVKMMDQNTIQVNFDAKIVGARDLVERGWSVPMALAPPCTDPTLEAGARHVRQVGYMTLLSVILTMPVLVLSWAPLPDKERKEVEFGSISLALATIIQFVVAGPFYPKALKALIFSRVIEMDLLIVLSTSAAYIYSVVAFGHLAAHKPLSTGEFFETSTLLVTLIMIGRFIAALARQKAVESISIRSLQSLMATIVDQGTEKEIDARLLQYGDVFLVSPDSKIPTDGTVISGSSEIDESMVTGESRPIEKIKGSLVIAGSINGSGALTVRLARIPGDNTISTIAGMVDEAKLSKPKIQEIADQVATYFVPVVVLVTIVVFCSWVAIGITVQHKSGSESVIQAVTYAITVLIVSCPCAIGLAVPIVIVVATGVAAERGVIFKSANAIEAAYKTSHVIFDKTGTLTQGKLTIAREEYPSASPSTKALLLGLIGSSKHPVSIAVAAHLKMEGVAASTVSDFKSVVGKGVEGTFAGHTLCAGNSRWLNLSNHSLVQPILSHGYTAFCFTVDGSLAAVFGLEDSLREDALQTVTKLQQSGISIHILSGDDDGAVRAVASQLNIPASNIRSRCTPADKQNYVKDLLATPDTRRLGKKVIEPVVMFCGDGTNDAIALAQATIGVHLNEGTDIAQSAADVVLMRPRLSGILIAITVSRKWFHRVVFNFGWSFVYNLFAILLAAGAFVHARIPPEYAGLGEMVSVLPVIAAGILLRWAKI
jgi:heavy metal translocating P-type ATPase